MCFQASIGEPSPDRLIPDKGDGSFCQDLADLLACFLDGQNCRSSFFVQGDGSFVKLLLSSPDTHCFLTKRTVPLVRAASVFLIRSARVPADTSSVASRQLPLKGKPFVRAASGFLDRLARVPAAASSVAPRQLPLKGKPGLRAARVPLSAFDPISVEEPAPLAGVVR